MPRCEQPQRRGLPTLFSAAVLAAALLGAASKAHTQTAVQRNFPATALRGELVVTQAPDVLLNQRPARLAPGARIRGTDNLLLLSGQLAGQRLVVHYTLDSLNQPLDVWVLSAAELARRPWPATAEQASSWSFNADTQRWSPR